MISNKEENESPKKTEENKNEIFHENIFLNNNQEEDGINQKIESQPIIEELNIQLETNKDEEKENTPIKEETSINKEKNEIIENLKESEEKIIIIENKDELYENKEEINIIEEKPQSMPTENNNNNNIIEKKDESDTKLSVITEKSDEFYIGDSAISLSLKKNEDLSDEKKLAIMDSILQGEGENQFSLSKRASIDTIGSLKNSLNKSLTKKDDKLMSLLTEQKKENKSIRNSNLVSSLHEIKEENIDDKKEENIEDKKEKEEKKEEKKFESKPSMTISKKARRVKTDGILPTFGGGDVNAAEERRNRLLKRLNKGKELTKKREEENKYKKSENITSKAETLEKKLTDKKEE